MEIYSLYLISNKISMDFVAESEKNPVEELVKMVTREKKKK